ncbi:hypothetical protein ACOMHN_043453 [Nucella lapillus]
MHFNENSNRSVKTDAAGNPKISVQLPKAKKGEYSIKIIKQKSTYAVEAEARSNLGPSGLRTTPRQSLERLCFS